MKILLIFSGIVSLVASSATYYDGVTVGISEHSHPVQSLYHAQDVYGQYVYGYATPTSAKTESRTADGVTRGGYSYIDSNGVLQTVEYTADPVHGFRVAATNLPRDLPDVALAKAQHLAEFAATKAHLERARADHVVRYSNPVVVPYDAVAPTPVQDLPEVAKARAEHLAAYEAIRARNAAIAADHAALATNPTFIGPVPSKVSRTFAVTGPEIANNHVAGHFHAQNVHGRYSYGYASPFGAKAETRTADGATKGGYSYIDANGLLQTVHYTADSVNGFRVSATNIPIDEHHVAHSIH